MDYVRRADCLGRETRMEPWHGIAECQNRRPSSPNLQFLCTEQNTKFPNKGNKCPAISSLRMISDICIGLMAKVYDCDLIVGVLSFVALAYCKMSILGCILGGSTLPMYLFSLVKSKQQPRVHNSSEWPCLSLFLLVWILLVLPLNFCLFLEDFSNFFFLYIAISLPIYTIDCFSE